MRIGGPPISTQATMQVIEDSLGMMEERKRWKSWAKTQHTVVQGPVVILPVNAVSFSRTELLD